VFNWLIGNCDAHAKNFSLLYDGSMPALAPLYDLVSTTIYPELTHRLAMSVDGARHIEDVAAEAWIALAREIDYSQRFVVAETSKLIGRVSEETMRLTRSSPHRNATARRVVDGIIARIEA
jgi:serine/threonine-protein kinase HipA